MITIKKDEHIVNLDGTPFKIEGTPLSVGRACALAVTSSNKSPDPLKAYKLARKITDGAGEIELADEEVVFIQESLKGFQGFTTLVIGQLLQKLEEPEKA